jgi:hypothetical protein
MEITDAEEQPDSKEGSLDDRRDDKLARWNFFTDRVDVVQAAERNPIVDREEQDLKGLEGDKDFFEHGREDWNRI